MVLSEQSDDFIQAQQQLARWASEDVVSVVVLDQPQSATISDSLPYNGVGPMSGATTSNAIHHQLPHHHHGDPQSSSAATAVAASNNCILGLPVVPNGTSVSQRDFYPSPPSTETESSGSAIQLRTRRVLQSADTVATSQQQLQLHQLPLYQQHHHQQQLQHQSGDTSSSNNSQSGQVIENGCYPEYKH
ncbi:GL11289 [Drosophila persimilis]|uniref:GL11289 n=1 Tax=Drosophila persimilis TaxID=7234 RepID=B4HA89_DROPE|nr:GL11289 [Drosophila persimilis]